MSAGTLALTNNSDVATGTGTTFTTELVAGDFVVAAVGGITYTLPVKAVGSDTALTLISKYAGPTQANLAWNVVPRATQNQVTAELVAQVTQALRGQNYDKANWQAVFSASGDITVLLPDGSTFNGPSWNKIAQLLADIDPVALQALADQVNANAQQVAIDRLDVDEKAAQAQADAQTASNAAGGAVAANDTAQQAKTDSLAAKAAAEAARDAAQQANPDNQLKKSNNLSDVADVSVARGNLAVYSKSEIDSKVTTVNARMGYALVDGGTIAANQRLVFTNPFGINTPVIVVPEIQLNSIWRDPGWGTYSTSTLNGAGVRAGFVIGEGLVAQAGGDRVFNAPATTGALQTYSPSMTSAALRLHVWKVTA